MTDRITALRALLEAVEAGRCPTDIDDTIEEASVVYDDALADRAFHGSFDSALVLLFAVMPGEIWGRYANGGMWIAYRANTFRAPPTMTPSRGLLWCILRVLIAMDEKV